MVATVALMVAAGAIFWTAPRERLPFFPLWLMLMLGVTALVPLVTIFLYRNRRRQISLLVAEMVLLAGSAGFAVYYAWIAYMVAAVAPSLVIVAMLTNWLAMRGVIRDEILVRSADRIR
jgi:hypothetical protein